MAGIKAEARARFARAAEIEIRTSASLRLCASPLCIKYFTHFAQNFVSRELKAPEEIAVNLRPQPKEKIQKLTTERVLMFAYLNQCFSVPISGKRIGAKSSQCGFPTAVYLALRSVGPSTHRGGNMIVFGCGGIPHSPRWTWATTVSTAAAPSRPGCKSRPAHGA